MGPAPLRRAPRPPAGASCAASCRPHGVTSRGPTWPSPWPSLRQDPHELPAFLVRRQKPAASPEPGGAGAPVLDPSPGAGGQCLLAGWAESGPSVDQTLRAELRAGSPGLSQPGCSQKRRAGSRPGRSLEERPADSASLRGWFREERVPGVERSALEVTLSAHRAGPGQDGEAPRAQATSMGLLGGGALGLQRSQGPGAGAGRGGC